MATYIGGRLGHVELAAHVERSAAFSRSTATSAGGASGSSSSGSGPSSARHDRGFTAGAFDGNRLTVDAGSDAGFTIADAARFLRDP